MITDADRIKLARAGYRVRGWEGQKAGLRRAVSLFASALNNPSNGMAALSGVGVNLSWWQRTKVRFFLWLNRRNAAQKIILNSMNFMGGEND